MRHPDHAHIVLGGTALLCAILIFLFALDNGISGRATDSTVLIVNSTPYNCTFTAAMGYNVLSIPCLAAAIPVEEVINGTSVQVMYQYIPGAQDPWKVYVTGLPSYVVSDLQYMTRRVGYIAIMNAAASKEIDGALADSTDIGLAPGWNLVGYPSKTVRAANVSFATIDPLTTLKVSYDTSTQQFITYPGTLNETRPNLGYWINATAATSWTVTP